MNKPLICPKGTIPHDDECIDLDRTKDICWWLIGDIADDISSSAVKERYGYYQGHWTTYAVDVQKEIIDVVMKDFDFADKDRDLVRSITDGIVDAVDNALEEDEEGLVLYSEEKDALSERLAKLIFALRSE